MFLATTNKCKRLLCLSYIGKVDAEDIRRGMADVQALAAEMPGGFRLLVDLSRLEAMDINCAAEIGRLMELCSQFNLEQLVRVIPDPQKDIGMNILMHFHYRHGPPVATCKTMTEAARALKL